MGLVIITRVVSLVYAALPLFCVHEVRGLLNKNYKEVENAYYFPIFQCTSTSFYYDASSAATTCGTDCNNYSWLINAVAAAVILSTIGTVFFLVVDFMVQRSRESLGKGTTLGMGMLLVFLLIQNATKYVGTG